MNPYIESVLRRLIPVLLAGLAPILARWIGADDAARLVADLGSLLLAILLSTLQAHRSRQVKLVALASNRPQTEAQALEKVSAGLAPSVLTPKNEVPVLGTGSGG